MSRLKDALLALLGKCTPEGTEPKGNNVDEILECMAEHFDAVIGRVFVVNHTKNANGSVTINATNEEIWKAHTDGRLIMLRIVETDGSILFVSTTYFITKTSIRFYFPSTFADANGLPVMCVCINNNVPSYVDGLIPYREA